MKKEVIIAIVLGLAVGLIVTYGMYRIRVALTRPDAQTTIEKLAASPSTQQEKTPTTITILHPEDGVILTETSLQVTGSSTPDSHVALFVNNTDYLSTTDSTGAFSFEVTLDQGVNILTVHVITAEGMVTTTDRTVVVSSLFVDNPASTPTATPAAELEK
jgi:hypothetical protein